MLGVVTRSISVAAIFQIPRNNARRHKNGSPGAYSHSVFNKGIIYETTPLYFLIVWPLSWEVPILAV